MTKKRKTFLHHRGQINPRFLRTRFVGLTTHPLFLLLTIAGNGLVVLAAIAFYFIERGTNSGLSTFLDALWWSVATVTTVGYGDVIPVTIVGKVLGMLLMIFGTALFSAFTALFAATLIEPELDEVEEEVRQLERAFEKEKSSA